MSILIIWLIKLFKRLDLVNFEIRYEALEASTDGVLEGQQLEKALHNLALFESDVLAMPDERLNEEVSFLRDELSCMRQQKCILKQQHNKLTMESTAKMDRLSKMKAVEEAKELEYRKSLEQIHLANSKVCWLYLNVLFCSVL